jgi:hypothetical protein
MPKRGNALPLSVAGLLGERSLEALLQTPFRVVLLLVLDVTEDEREVLFPEADDAESTLPIECSESLCLVHAPRAGTFEVADEVADGDEGLNAEGEVHVVLGSANGVKENALCGSATAAEEVVDGVLEIVLQERGVVSGVPDNVDEYIVENMLGHG